MGVLALDQEGKAGARKGKATPAASARHARQLPAEGSVGPALRSAYQQTIEEAIPPEMLDLLGKLA